jgi:hypothetical protein
MNTLSGNKQKKVNLALLANLLANLLAILLANLLAILLANLLATLLVAAPGRILLWQILRSSSVF